MESQRNNEERKPLISVEFQTEIDVATGKAGRRMFVKMYFEARDSGLLAAMPDELWKTLCCLATYIDENGHCFPSQSLLAKDLGISRQHINKRIQRLLAFQFNGMPILTVSKNRENKRGGSRWTNNVYQLRPITGFAIFDEQKGVITSDIEQSEIKSSMSPQGDIELRQPSVSPSVSCEGDTREGDTNQTYELTRRLNVSDFRKFSTEQRASSGTVDDGRVANLVSEILRICGDSHSWKFYRMIARRAPSNLIFTALSETKHRVRDGRITKSRGAFFTDKLMRLVRERGIDLRLATRPKAKNEKIY